jgi:hypothetical protein
VEEPLSGLVSVPGVEAYKDTTKDPRGAVTPVKILKTQKYPLNVRSKKQGDRRAVSQCLCQTKDCFQIEFPRGKGQNPRWEEINEAETEELRDIHKAEQPNKGVLEGQFEPH